MGSIVRRLDVVAGRKYQTRQGEDKTHWINVGEGAEWDDGGITLRLHAVPVGQWFDGTLKLFERKDRDRDRDQAQRGGGSPSGRQRTRAQADGPAGDDFEDSDIPFATNRGVF